MLFRSIAPSLTPVLYVFYNGVDVSSYVFSSVREQEITRWFAVAPFGVTLVFVLCALRPPRMLFNPVRPWLYLLIFGLITIFASGFRNVLLQALVALGLAAWFHRGWRELALGALCGLILLGAVIAGQDRKSTRLNSSHSSVSRMPSSA